MRTDTNISICAGMPDREQQTGKFGTVSISGKEREMEKENRHSVMLTGQFDPIEQKKALAKKQAYKIVRDALANELKMDSSVQEVKDHAEGLQTELDAAQEEIRKIDERRKALRAESGVDKESEEQSDMELLKKREAYEDTVQKAQTGIIADNAVVRGTRLERLKKDFIRKAQSKKDDMLAAASREVIGMLADEAKDHIDEKSEERQEKAEERAQEKEAEQEKLDAVKEKKEQMEAMAAPEKKTDNVSRVQTEQISGDSMTEVMVQLDGQRADHQQEIEEMVRKMGLLTEDIKGIKVDEIF